MTSRWSLPSPYHNLSHFLKTLLDPPPFSSMVYFMDGSKVFLDDECIFKLRQVAKMLLIAKLTITLQMLKNNLKLNELMVNVQTYLADLG